MSDLKLPRLLAAAKEFNIGQDTLVEFLTGKGFSRDDLKPAARLSESMYAALQKEFQSDKVAKAKSDMIDLPRSPGAETRFRKDEPEHAPVQPVQPAQEAEPAPPPPAEPEPQPEPTPAPEPAPAPQEPVTEPVQPEPVEPPKPEPQVPAEQPPVEETPVEAPAAREEPKTTEKVIEGPRVLGTIDLSAIDNSTRPKKTRKKEEPAPAPKEEELRKPAAEATQPVAKTEQKTEMPQETKPAEAEEEKQITNIEVEKLSGPKILGKIDLSKTQDRPSKPSDGGNRRRRKRIPVKGDDIKPAASDPRSKPQGRSNDRNKPMGRGKGKHQQEDRVIDEKEISEKLRETQARISGATHGRSSRSRAKMRKKERRELLEAEEGATDNNLLEVTEFLSASELANLMDVTPTEVVSKCFSLGLMVSINQRLDAEVIELVANEFGYEVQFVDLEDHDDDEEEIEDDPEDLKPRAPIVTIMGHVDHGKTSLLDYIRHANVVSGEAGGITQHIGAYEVNTSQGRKITFLDTPGHEAFTAMRARGAKLTDIAVIVVAADDAVMPQTKEAISHAQAANVPMIFAVNKIDKDGANPQKIYEQLAGMNILVEEWGGKFQSQEISAKKGLNIDQLLEKIILEADLLELTANPEREGIGTVVEASLDKGRGYVATLLVQNGTLENGDIVVSGQYYGRVKAMFNERNARIEKAGPATPALILGLNGAPQAGEKFRVYEDEAEAKQVASKRGQILREQGMRVRKHITLDEIGRRLALGNFKELNVIIKGDVDGSVEALSDSLQKLSTEEIVVRVILKGVGAISENDVTLASASDAIIIGFNVRANAQANRLAEQEGIEIKQYSIIYNAINDVKAAMEGLLEPKVEEREVASVEIREVFRFDKAVVAGCYVTSGKIKRDAKIRLYRDEVLIYPRQEGAFAELGSLKRFKDDVKEVSNGMECGLTIKNFADINAGDVVVAFEQEEVKRTL